MSIIKDVTIINETRLRLDTDAKAGDEIAKTKYYRFKNIIFNCHLYKINYQNLI